MRLAAMFVLLALPTPARADPGSQHLSVAAGYSTFSIPDHSPDGTTLGVDYEVGIADVVRLRVSAGAGLYFADQKNYSAQGVVGLTYHLDITRVVPFASVGVGGIALGGGEIETDLSGMLELAVGADFIHSRDFSYGVVLRSETFIESVSYFALTARVSWRL